MHEEAPEHPRTTRFVCTLGPLTEDDPLPAALVDAGMTIARINGAHGTLEELEALIERARQLLDGRCPILLDLPGAKVRTEGLGEGVDLESGQRFRLARANLTIPDALELFEADHRVSAADGTIEMRVIGRDADGVDLEVLSGGLLKNRKGLVVRGLGARLPLDLARDQALLDIARRQEVAYVGLSFVRRGEHVRRMRALLVDSPIRIVAKVETAEALDDLDAILDEADLVMIDRGDLEAEIGREQVPLATRRVLARAREVGTPTIVASQFLLSMMTSPIPSMAEVSDIAHAVLDGADHLMLSEETAIGAHPTESVALMQSVALAAERERQARPTAIILAAGTSPGLGSLTRTRHESLLDVGGITIIQHQLENLAACGIPSDRVTVVTGHGASALEAYLRGEGFTGRFVLNPWFSTSHIMASLWLARASGPTVVLYGDILFDPQILAALLECPAPLALAVDERSECTPEDEKVRVVDGCITDAGKELPQTEATGEFIGLLRADRGAMAALQATMEIMVREGRMDAFLTEALLRLANDSDVALSAVPIGERAWCDNDFLPDLERSRREVWPALRAAREERQG